MADTTGKTPDKDIPETAADDSPAKPAEPARTPEPARPGFFGRLAARNDDRHDNRGDGTSDTAAAGRDDGRLGTYRGDDRLAGDRFAAPQAHDGPRGPRIRALGAVLLILVSMAAGFLGGWLGANRTDATNNVATTTQQRVVTSESQLISGIAKNVGASVVSVDVTGQQQVGNSFFGGGLTQTSSAGTGIIITSNGLVVTNRHVVPQGTTNVKVTLADGTQLDNVTVVGRTSETDPLDIAFLKINDTKGKKLSPAKIGDSSKMVVGDRVVAIGNALGQFQNTVTSGIISGFGRDVQAGDSSGTGSTENLQDLFQTDAAINEGNSGGPLVNMGGEVIGINTAIAGNAQNIGFAIPVNNISGMIKNVIATGKFQQPYLGVRYVSLTNDIAQQFNLKVNRGAYILPADQTGQPAVVPGSPADKAGLQGGDVIEAVDGTKIDENHGLTTLLSGKAVGDQVTLRILRDGKEMDVKVTLGAAPNADNTQNSSQQ